jgi:hypothetical protein
MVQSIIIFHDSTILDTLIDSNYSEFTLVKFYCRHL